MSRNESRRLKQQSSEEGPTRPMDADRPEMLGGRVMAQTVRLKGTQMKINTNASGLPILEQFSEEGFIDCVFAITQLKEIDNHYYFHMAASYNGVEVGVDVQVVKGITSGFDAEMQLIKEHVYREGVQFIRSGPESDRLMSAIAHLYEMQHEVGAMVASETFRQT